jgi:beta-mannosidase
MALVREKVLNGQWELRDEIISFNLADAHKLSQSRRGWIPQPVPGDIHQGLIAAGKIKEPLVGLNFIDCKWTEDRSWWFRKSFDVPADWTRADLVELEIHGLDSNAEVFLNGDHVGSHRNAFRPLIVAVNGHLKSGRNTLLVRLTTGVENITQKDIDSTDGILPTTEAPHGYPERGEIRRAFVRKPQYSFGWDWSPRVATTAIAGDVRIRAINAGCIRQVNLQPARHGDNEVIVTATVVVDCLHYYKTIDGTVTVTLTGPDGKKFKASQSSLLCSGYNFIKLRIPIKKPQLWWPNGFGEQNLYKVEAKLQIGKDATDYPAFDYGIRFVELDTNDKFAIVINGKKVFCRGANWIPADAIYARVTDEHYEHLVREARDANFNMLRIWGGGWYERDAFYQACDRHGIMLWHDFMFACAPYPDHIESFRSEIEKEIDYQTGRLSRHACITIWCGCNENQWGFRDWWREQTKAGARIYNYLLPSIVQRNCPQIPYWNGSPYGGDAPNSENVGDHHRWHECMMHPDMEKRITPEEYDKCASLFVSEFGYVGACSRETIEEYLGGAALDPASEVWRQHTNVFEKNTVAAGIRKHYADPERLSIDHYLLYSGLCQGLMYQYALESMRYRPNCHGGLFWMFEDCWGEVGWTIIDYYLRRKPSFYFVRRAFAPIRLILRAKGSRISVIAANDTAETVNLNIECGYISLDGGNSDLKSFKVKLPALERTECCVFSKGKHDPMLGLWIARCKNNASVRPAVFRAVDYRLLKTSDPNLVYAVTRDRAGCCFVQIRAGRYAHAVHFILPADSTRSPQADAIPEDDFFDLLPGETRTVRIVSVKPFDAADVKVTCVNEMQKK